MKGTITKIDARKKGNGAEFKRVYFELEDGGWAKTDLCPAFQNWRRWENLLHEGNLLDGLVMRDKSTVNADSYPRLVPKPATPEQLSFC